MCANSMAQAAQLVELHSHRIVLMFIDVVLARPECRRTGEDKPCPLDGSELFALLEHRCPHAIGIQMSAYTTQELAENGYQLQSQHFLKKPITLPCFGQQSRTCYRTSQCPRSRFSLPAMSPGAADCANVYALDCL